MSQPHPSSRFTALFHRYLTEGASPKRQAVALGLGIFIGCLPLWGLHLPVCLLAGWAFGLNRLKMYVAANVSNPLFSPFLIFVSVQLGAVLLQGSAHALSFEAFRAMDPWTFGEQLVLGSAVLGISLGLFIGLAAYRLLASPSLHRDEATLLDEAADRYLVNGIGSWAFAFWKLRLDPMYRAIAAGGLLPPGGRIVDVGCGSGLLFALLRTAEAARARGALPDTWKGPREGIDLHGIDRDFKALARARLALGESASFIEAGSPLPAAEAVLFLDVLHYMDPSEQERSLEAARDALTNGGVLIIRDADAEQGLAFHAVRLSERLRSLARGRWRERHHYRSAAAWTRHLESLGFRAETRPMGEGTPFANFLIRAVKSEAAA